MNKTTLTHRFAKGLYLFLIAALALALSLGQPPPVAHADEGDEGTVTLTATRDGLKESSQDSIRLTLETPAGLEVTQDEQGYDTIRRGISFGVKKEYFEDYTVNLKYRLELVEYENVSLVILDEEEEEELDPINITSLILLLGYDLRDDPVLPHEGSYHLLGFEVATSYLGGDTEFNKYTFETTWYWPLTVL